MIKTKSIRFKVSVLYVAILALILLVYSTILYASLQHILYRELDSRLKTKTEEVEGLLNSIAPTSGDVVASFLEKRILQILEKYEMRDDYVALMKMDGQTVTFSKNISPALLNDFNLQLNHLIRVQKAVINTVNFDQKRLRLISKPIRFLDGQWYAIQIATSLNSVDRTTKRLLWVIFFSIVGIILLTSSIGAWFVTNILSPVSAVAKTAEGITRGDLGARVQLKDLDEEMQYLVGAFNRMIERLEKSFQHISDFSSHVAHELKTPLAVIRGESEIALKKERTGEEYQNALKANLREAQRMIHVVEDMLFLSRLDYDPKELGFKPMNLIPFLHDIAEKAKILADPKKIEVSFQTSLNEAFISGDEGKLRRLFLNIIDNAIKFTPNSGTIRINLSREGEYLVTSITDTGIGISEADLPRIFDRFFHRAQIGSTVPGSGLGLHIALAIAKAHKGDIGVQSQIGHGTTFKVSLPKKILISL